MNFNKVIMAGNLTRDIELKYLPKGTAVGKGSLAVNRKWRTEDGEEKEEVAFVEFEVWGKTAENAQQYTAKGSNVQIEGRLKMETWEDKATGAKRSKLVVTVETMQFISFKDRPTQEAGPAAATPPPRAPMRPLGRPAPDAHSGPPVDDDDVPF